MPIVKVKRKIRAARNRMTSFFPSHKNDAMVPSESLLESEYCYYLELSPQVARYESQPFRLCYRSHGKPRRYTPDFLVIPTDEARRPLVVEIKLDVRLTPDLLARLDEVRQEFSAEGYDFLLVTDAFIRQQPLFWNVKWVHRFRRYPYAEAEVQQALDLVTPLGTARLERLEQALEGVVAKPRCLLFHLISLGALSMEWTQPLTVNTLIGRQLCSLEFQ